MRFMCKIFRLSLIFLSLFSPVYGAAVLQGRILDGQGSPIKGARLISGENSREMAVSGPGGMFEIGDSILPEEIIVSCPGYEILKIALTAELLEQASGEIEITLRRKPKLSEEITVNASLPLPGFAPVAASSATIEPRQLPDMPKALLDVVKSVPGVSANGQGGMFQTYSIRGISRHRVRSSILDARLAGDRRAGVSASFIDPFLYGSVDVLKGPSSSYHGSGALGGVIRLMPRKFSGYSLDLGYGLQGNEFYTASGWGDDDWSIGLVRKAAGNSETPDGTSINSHFTQYSGLLSRSWKTRGATVEAIVMPSMGLRLGKASTDYDKGKVTEYPAEKHLIAHMSVKLVSGWDFSGFFHPHSVATAVRTEESISRVETNSYDSGLNVRKRLYRDEKTEFTVGAEYFSRSGVDSVENQWSFLEPAPSIPFYSLDGASQDEAGFLGDVRRDFSPLILEGGIRYTWSRQSNGGMNSLKDSSWNGYGGVVVPVNQGFKFKGSLGTGLRFPSLTELFYGGTTGRGSVEGNSALVPERAFLLEGGLEWLGPNFIFTASAFRNGINDYIERVEVDPLGDPDHLTYLNLTSGTIRGLEWELAASPLHYLDLVWRGHLMKGRDNLGNPLADIPVHRSTIGARYSRGSWVGGLNWQYRASKNNPGSGEKLIGAASISSGFIRKAITRQLEIILSGSNLSNEEYYNSADKKVPLSAGRSITVSLRWKLSGPDDYSAERKDFQAR